MKRILPIVLAIILCLTMTVSANEFEEEANILKSLGVFKGTDNGFELDREPTRIEGLVMFVRLLGMESEALSGDYNHPFTDVPVWADGYVGWAYESGYTKGVGEGKFGTGNIQSKSYFTFILRALGYEDGTDFSWDMAIGKSEELGLISQEELESYTSGVFTRGGVADISLKALKQSVKGQVSSLGFKLVNEGALDKSIAMAADVYREFPVYDSLPDYTRIEKFTKIEVEADGELIRLVYEMIPERFEYDFSKEFMSYNTELHTKKSCHIVTE